MSKRGDASHIFTETAAEELTTFSLKSKNEITALPFFAHKNDVPQEPSCKDKKRTEIGFLYHGLAASNCFRQTHTVHTLSVDRVRRKIIKDSGNASTLKGATNISLKSYRHCQIWHV